MKKIFLLVAALSGLLMSVPVIAQSDLDRAKNLATCLSGRYPSLCKKHWLSVEDSKKAENAERSENLKTCLTGRYPSLCKRNKLTADELRQVEASERAENLKTCMTGRYRSLCKKNLLTERELEQVVTAEKSENLRTCLAGNYASLCDKSGLTDEQRSQVLAAEQRAAQSKTANGGSAPLRIRRSSSSNCESGHWIESVSDGGEIIKLEDGSIWQVDALDIIDSALWLPTSEIVVCDDKLINTDDNETVSATRLR